MFEVKLTIEPHEDGVHCGECMYRFGFLCVKSFDPEAMNGHQVRVELAKNRREGTYIRRQSCLDCERAFETKPTTNG